MHGEASAKVTEAEVANLQQQPTTELQDTRDETDRLVVELQAAQQVVEANDNDVGEAFELTGALAKGDEVVGFVKQAAEELHEAQTRIDSLVSKLETFYS